MAFELNNSIEILQRTPLILDAYLSGIPDTWLHNNEGDATWSPYDVLGHLIFGEKTDWMIRVRIILSDSDDKIFEPFDRFAQIKEGNTTPAGKLLEEFGALRKQNIFDLKAMNVNAKDLAKTGTHPAFGEVKLEQLISTWVVHDLGHIAQISRVMAKQYKTEVGPWIAYLNVLK